MRANAKILLIEDDESSVRLFQNAVDEYNSDNSEQEIVPEIARNISEAKEKLDNSFDGAIIDLKLREEENGEEDEEGGNKINQEIGNSFFRIPVIYYTALPNLAEDTDDSPVLAVFTKGEKTYRDAIDMLVDVYNTGITRILGGRGEIEKLLYAVFIQNLLPQRATWIAHGKTNSDETEKALLRYTINHLIQQLDEDCKEYFPEEFYLSSLKNGIQTGSIVQEKETGATNYFVILTPSCDLFVRKGKSKTDTYLLVKIGNLEVGNKALYYHELPKTKLFPGGSLNFRHIETIKKENFDKEFEKSRVQISPPFIKNIIARFSSYYARQGEPEIR